MAEASLPILYTFTFLPYHGSSNTLFTSPQFSSFVFKNREQKYWDYRNNS